jgi:hypothetical protein
VPSGGKDAGEELELVEGQIVWLRAEAESEPVTA